MIPLGCFDVAEKEIQQCVIPYTTLRRPFTQAISAGAVFVAIFTATFCRAWV